MPLGPLPRAYGGVVSDSGPACLPEAPGASCHWDPFSTRAYGSVACDECLAPILGMHLCQKLQGTACHWDPFFEYIYGGTVSGDSLAPILDMHLCQMLQDPCASNPC